MTMKADFGYSIDLIVLAIQSTVSSLPCISALNGGLQYYNVVSLYKHMYHLEQTSYKRRKCNKMSGQNGNL